MNHEAVVPHHPGPRPALAPVPLRHHGAIHDIARALWQNRKARAGLILLGILIVVTIFGPWMTPYNPTASNFPTMLHPSARHWLGTTQAGQDVLSELIYGTRACRYGVQYLLQCQRREARGVGSHRCPALFQCDLLNRFKILMQTLAAEFVKCERHAV